MLTTDSFLNLLAPHHCLRCNQEGSLCCQICLRRIKQPKHKQTCCFCNKKIASPKTTNGICPKCSPTQSLDSVTSYGDYKNEFISGLVKSLKFDQIHAARKPIAQSLAALSIPVQHIHSRIIVTAVPTANKRVRNRGWDQAKLIAKEYAKLKKLTYKSLLLRTSSFDQIGASKLERSEASKKFFKPLRSNIIKNSVIILIDDVVTTGSSLNSAAKVLKSAGAKEVHALTFAHQPLGKLKKN